MNSMPLLVAAVFLMCSMVSSISDGILTDIGSTMEKESVTLVIRDQSHSPLVITIEEDGEVRSSLEKPSTTKATRSKRFRHYIIVEEIVDDKQPDEEESDSPSTESASTTAALTTSPAEGRRLKEFQQDKWKQPYPWWISDLIAAQIRSEYERLTSTPMPSVPVNHTNTNDTNTTAPIPIIPSWWPSSNHTLPSTTTPTIVPSPAPSNDLIAQATSW